MNSSKNPNVSCVLATNRFDNFIIMAVNSILNQSYTNFELLIMVNGDPEIYQKIKNLFTDHRIHVHFSSIQQLAYNLNKGIDLARGKYIARMDADDICYKNRFAVQVNFLDNNLSVSLVSSLVKNIDQNGYEIYSKSYLPKFLQRKLWLKNAINHPAAMFRRDSILKAGGYSSSISQDYDLWLRLERYNKNFFAIIEEPLLEFRSHSGQTRGKIEGYASSAGFLLREFIIRLNLLYLLGSCLMTLRALFSSRVKK